MKKEILKINIDKLRNINKNNLSISKISIKFDWIILFSVWVITFLVLIFFAVNIYNSIYNSSRTASKNAESKSSVKFDTVQLDRVITEFQKREEKFNKF